MASVKIRRKEAKNSHGVEEKEGCRLRFYFTAVSYHRIETSEIFFLYRDFTLHFEAFEFLKQSAVVDKEDRQGQGEAVRLNLYM